MIFSENVIGCIITQWLKHLLFYFVETFHAIKFKILVTDHIKNVFAVIEKNIVYRLCWTTIVTVIMFFRLINWF